MPCGEMHTGKLGFIFSFHLHSSVCRSGGLCVSLVLNSTAALYWTDDAGLLLSPSDEKTPHVACKEPWAAPRQGGGTCAPAQSRVSSRGLEARRGLLPLALGGPVEAGNNGCMLRTDFIVGIHGEWVV